MQKPNLAKVAYDAYCQSRNWKSVRGEPLPQFDQQHIELQTAWMAAAAAVMEADTDHCFNFAKWCAETLEQTAAVIREAGKTANEKLRDGAPETPPTN